MIRDNIMGGGILLNELIKVSPLALLIVGTLILFSYGMLTQFFFGNHAVINRKVYFGVQLLLILVIINLSSLLVFGDYDIKTLVFFDQLVVGRAYYWIQLFIVTIGIITLPLISVYGRQWRNYNYELLILYCVSIFSLLILVSVNDLLLLYIAIELQGLVFYAMAASNTRSLYSAEAGLKYFILSALASGFFLFGVVLLYFVSGTLNFYQLALSFQGYTFGCDIGAMCSADSLLLYRNVCLMAGSFLLFGLSMKLGAAPFHNWVPDVYEGSPFFVTVVFSILPKIGLTIILARLLYQSFMSFTLVSPTLIGYPVGDGISVFSGFSSISINYILLLIGLLSIFVGTLGALGQMSIKRFVAYSSVSNVGYILLGLGSFTMDGLEASMFYLVVYSLVVLNFFLIVFSLKMSAKLRVSSIPKLLELRSPHFVALLALSLFSLAGVPPLAGFYSKFYVYYSLVSISAHITLGLAMLLSVLSAFYYIRVIVLMFFVPTLMSNIPTVSDYRFIFSVVYCKLGFNAVFFIVLTGLFNLFLFLGIELLLLWFDFFMQFFF